jgi:GAF domain-containing protein
MLNNIRNFFTPPVFEDQEKARIAGLLNSILISMLVATTLALPALALSTDAANLIPLFLVTVPFMVINLGAYFIMRRGNVHLASNIFLLSTGIGIFGSYALSEPESINTTLSLTILFALTALLLDARAIARLIVVTIVLTLIVNIARTRGWIEPVFITDQNPMSNWITNSFIFLLTGMGLYLSSVSLRRAFDNARASQESLQTTNQELNELRKELEIRIQERTAAIAQQAVQLNAVSSVARTIASIQDIDTLLPGIAKLVSEQFGFYHVGIFLLDEQGEYAVLRASNSEGGEKMLARQHKLKLDSNSIVGYSTSHGEARIALDVGTDAVFFNNPDLPETRSEMALPLRISGRIIGALDVQSRTPNAFTKEDIATLTTLADQITIAIENARLFEEAREALSEAQDAFEKYVKQEWGNFAQQARHKGFIFDGKQILPLSNEVQRERAKTIQTGRLSLEKTSSFLSIPIKLRGQTIGVLDVRAKKGPREWTADEISLLEAAAERAALALENARLVESSQRRASRERTIGEISTKIGSVSDIESILQTAVEELGRRIGGAAEVTLEIDSNGSKAV